MIVIFIVIASAGIFFGIYYVRNTVGIKQTEDVKAALVVVFAIIFVSAVFALANIIKEIAEKVFQTGYFALEKAMLIMGLLAGAGGYVYFLIKNKEKEQLIKKAQEVFIAKTRVSNQLDYRKMVVKIIDEFYEKNRRADNAAELIRSCADDSLELKAFLRAYENAGDM
ncbi:MAG: hypothetical protein WC900_09240, partial [Oscillospiraceae bacterium]